MTLYIVNYAEILSKSFIVDAASEQDAYECLACAVEAGDVELTLDNYLEDSGEVTIDGPANATDLDLLPPFDDETAAAIGEVKKSIAELMERDEIIVPDSETSVAQIAKEAIENTRGSDDPCVARAAATPPEISGTHTIANLSKEARERIARQTNQRPHPTIPPNHSL